MRLLEVTLPTRDVLATASFYASALGLPVSVSATERSATVLLGETELVFEEDAGLAGAQHLAFTVPTGSLDAAGEWLRGRVGLLGRDGAAVEEPVVVAGPRWNARSVYFDGPDGQVLEVIERRDLRHDRCDGHGVGFGADGLLCVSEVGIAVPDVLATAALLGRRGIAEYGGPASAGFAAVGDVDGLLILVPPGRAWFPTEDRLASESAAVIGFEGAGDILLAPGRVLRGRR